MLRDDDFSLQVTILWLRKESSGESTATAVANGLPKIFDLFRYKSKKMFHQ